MKPLIWLLCVMAAIAMIVATFSEIPPLARILALAGFVFFAALCAKIHEWTLE